MRIWQNIIGISFLLLAGCSWLQGSQPPIQQGNVLSQAMIDQLKPGMSQEAVREVLGTPTLNNTFEGPRWDYVYTYQDKHHSLSTQHITVYFKNNRLSRYTGVLKPHPEVNP